MKHPKPSLQRRRTAWPAFAVLGVAIVAAVGFGLAFVMGGGAEQTVPPSSVARVDTERLPEAAPSAEISARSTPEPKRENEAAVVRDTAPKAAVAVPAIRTEAELTRRLAEIDSAARVRGAVLDDDIRVGVAAIDASRGALGHEPMTIRKNRFVREMKLLESHLRLKPTLDQLRGLATELQATTDAQARGRITTAYQVAANKLPPIERLEALARLRRLSPL